MSKAVTTEIVEAAREKVFAVNKKVRDAISEGFSTEAKRKELNEQISRFVWADVVRQAICNTQPWVANDASQDEKDRYYECGMSLVDLHNVRQKHYDYALEVDPSVAPLLDMARELVALRAELKAYVLAPKKTPKRERAPELGEAFKNVGHCPCCGREYAVLDKTGGMSKHGYKVDKNWSIFTGVCSGETHAPIERERTFADENVAMHSEQSKTLAKRAEDMLAGKISPMQINRGTSRKPELVLFAECSEREQREARSEAVRSLNYEAGQHERFAKFLQGVIEKYHGQPLRRVVA